MRNLRVRLLSVAVVIPLVFGAAACGDDDGGGAGGVPQSRGAMVDRIARELAAEDEVGLDDAEARCMAEAIVDEVGLSRLQSGLGSAGGSFEDIDDDELGAEVGLALFTAMFECMGDVDGLFTPTD